jgi:hypothetical protein
MLLSLTKKKRGRIRLLERETESSPSHADLEATDYIHLRVKCDAGLSFDLTTSLLQSIRIIDQDISISATHEKKSIPASFRSWKSENFKCTITCFIPFFNILLPYYTLLPFLVLLSSTSVLSSLFSPHLAPFPILEYSLRH